jgi:hypothetical protein
MPMKKYFICLANSKKYGERCIAGIEVIKNTDANDYSIVTKNNLPKWIRPVTGELYGQVPSKLVENINLLDIVAIEVLEEIPNGYQAENNSFEPKSLKVVGKLRPLPDNLNALIDHQQLNLFGNKGKAIDFDIASTIGKSLTFIRVHRPLLYIKKEGEKEQIRLKLSYEIVEYDLPITDIKFLEYCEKNKDVPIEKLLKGDVYLAISLGIEFEGWFFKLVAGVIFFP